MTQRPLPTPQLTRTRVMAILRSADASGLPVAARALAAGGITCLEVTLTTAGALDAIARIKDELGAVKDELGAAVSVGAGTVLTAADVRDALAAGAEFLVAPNVEPDVVRAAADQGIPFYPGAWTATEVTTAWRAGAAAVKLFPACTGGPAHLRQLRAPLPEIPLMAVGGVDLEAAGQYIAAGALAVGVGSPLLRDADRDPTPEALSALTARARALLATVRPGTGPEETQL
ncbi:bifunctional 4-hydroxy-2-oxoglutarate aldolase/2-dehydro-3-deoxy-phosphogluconate aldolase [Streptomyces sp. NPDC088350]|uniref:bifunctional 4-hydroxy-2-oxoglutarate aldolase/2-dehydro-3-deoxy-phosphogluconate aldolase n=1 Tax=Streptomyces sp. NPDC088350 TaxID=3365854 RepID=UPI003807FCD3